MVWKEQKLVELRNQFIQQLTEKRQSISELCRQFEISRVTAYKWIKRFEIEGLDGLHDRSKRASTSPNKTSSEWVDLILENKDQAPAWGARKLRKIMMDKGIQNLPSEATFNRILKIHGKIDLEMSNKREKFIRFEHENPNDLWQMDFKGHFQMQKGRCHPLTLIDDHSRFSLCIKCLDNECGESVKNTLKEVFIEYGLPLRMTMDNGPQWKAASKLSVWLMRHGIKVSHSRPYHPQTQGKLERFHRTLKEEVLKHRQFKDLIDAQNNFNEWRNLYNSKRPHEGVGMDYPINRFEKSSRIYTEKLPEIKYLSDDTIRKVMSCGRISYQGKEHYVGEFLKGEFVALRRMKENALEIIYVNTRLGHIAA